jgi:hypothetical protein
MAHQWTNEELTKFYEGVNGAIKKLLRRITMLDSEKASTEELESLSLRLSDSTTVVASDDGLETTVSDLAGRMSSIEQTADTITLRVTNAETLASNAAASAQSAESTITQTADQIELRVQGAESSASNAENSASTALETAQSAVSTVTQLADSITLSVVSGSRSATLSLSVNGETQTASIDLSGLVTFSDLSTKGRTTIHGGNIDTESLFAQAIQATAFELARSAAGFPSFTLTGTNSSFSISATNTSMQEATTFLQADGELSLSSDAAIVLSPGSKTGGSGYTGVAIEGSITEGTWEGDVIDIAHGGTGASTAAQARANLGISTGTSATSGSWTPTVSGGSSYTRRKGWYTKVGSVVTVGWDVYCSKTTSGTKVTITGLPYTPGNYAWGGGSCSGYTGDDGVVFSGWGATSSGSIYGYGQDSEASGNRYQAEITCTGGAMLAGGTITYTI